MTNMPPNSGGPESQIPGRPPSEGGLRLISTLVLIVSVLGLLAVGFCALSVVGDGLMSSGGDLIWVVVIAAPFILFFIGCIKVCLELKRRLTP